MFNDQTISTMITGSIVAIATPMKSDSSVDWDAFAELIEWQILNGTNGIVVAGTTGESATLSPEEHIHCIEFVVDKVASRVPVIAGTGANSTTEAIHLAKSAEASGCDAHLSVVPYYNKPTQEGLYQHFLAIAESCNLPLILYNVPGRTACDLLPETVLRLSQIKNIVGIKEASTLERCLELIDKCPSEFAIYSGDDPIALEVVHRGGVGVISVTANIAPKQVSDMMALAKTDYTQAKQIDNGLADVHQSMFIEPNPIPVKWALYRMGFIKNSIRLPLVPLSTENQTCVEETLRQANLIN